MAKIPQIIVCNGHGLGEYCDVKRIPNPGETCIAYNRRFEMDAGKGTNAACAIGRLGGSVAFVGKCGVDQCGELGYKWMGESNVDTGWIPPLNRAWVYASSLKTARTCYSILTMTYVASNLMKWTVAFVKWRMPGM